MNTEINERGNSESYDAACGNAGESVHEENDLWLTRVFDRIGDLFSKMVRGVFAFAFKTLPVTLWHLLFNQRLFRLVKSAARMIFWIAIWIVVIFASWLLIDIEKFKDFWKTVLDICLECIQELAGLVGVYANEVWIVIALIGSVYGLLYLPTRRFYRRRREESRKTNVDESTENGGHGVASDA